MMRITRFLAAALVLGPALVAAQQPRGRTLALDEAMRLAETQSEGVRIAQAGVLRARGQQMEARSQFLPQVNASLTYTRTLASQFEALQAGPAPVPPPGTPPVPPPDTSTFFQPCTRYLAPGGATDVERLVGLETFARCSSGGGLGIDFSRVGFGAKNEYRVGLQGSVTLFSGGRVQAQNRSADAGRRSAEIELASQRATIYLNVTEAYFDAVLTDRLVAIAESSLVQTETALRQTQLARQVGNQSEFELLRAQVSRSNQLPAVIQRRTARDLAYLRLKQLLNIPFTETLVLSTQLADERQLMSVAQAGGVSAGGAASDTSASARAPVRQLEEAVTAQRSALRSARAEWLPAITLSSQYGRVAFPAAGVPQWSNFLSNWTVSLGATLPLFTGGRIKGSTLVAEAGLREAQARLDQTRELASLDARQAIAQLEEAQATFEASAGTAEQATRAYTIAEVRYREGLSTQLELTDSRLLLQQATANRAQAIRDLQVARIRLALLRDLPIGAGASTTFPAGSPAGGASQSAPAQAAPGLTAPSTGRAAATQASAQVVPP
jgi:outer membrane protein TolC